MVSSIKKLSILLSISALFGYIQANQPVNYNAMRHGQWALTQEADLKQQFGSLVFDKKTNQAGVRKHEIYIPRVVSNTQKPLVLFVVHGTWAQESASYFDVEKPFYRYIRQFARDLSEKRGTPIELISFRWEGKNSSKARKAGSIALSSIMNYYYSHAEVMTIAHSHGCNVVNAATQYLAYGSQIEHIIHLAAPVRDSFEVDYKPQNFKHLTQFYSTSDGVAAVGSVAPWWKAWTLGSRKFESQAGRRVVNIRVQINGSDCGHSNIKAVACYLTDILHKASGYQFNTDLDLNVILANNQNEYDKYYEPGLDNTMLAVRKYNNAQELIKTIATKDSDKLAIAEQFAAEYKLSEYQKAEFKARYGRDIAQKEGLFSRFRQAVYEDFFHKIF